MDHIQFFKHNIEKPDIENAIDVLQSIFLTTGDSVSSFEHAFCKYLSSRHGVGITSCTAALHLSLLACGIGSRDEVVQHR